LQKVAVAGFCGTVFTGVYLFAVRPFDYLEQRPAFLFKMAILAVCNAAIYPRVPNIRIRQVQAALSLMLWIMVLLAGRFIAFSHG
jgi:hypothetical protein